MVTLKERLLNVVNVYKAVLNPFDDLGVSSSAKNKTVKSALEFVGNNPFSTALLLTPVSKAVSATKSLTGGISSVASKAVTAVKSLSTTKKVATVATASLAVPVLVGSEKARVAVIETASAFTPEKLAKFGSDIGKNIDNPSFEGAKNLIMNNKAIVGGLALGAVIIGGKAGTNLVSNITNTLATRENTQAINKVLENSTKSIPTSVPAATPITSTAAGSTPKAADVIATTPPTAQMPDDKVKKSTTKRRKKRKIYKARVSKELNGRFNLRLS